MSDRGAFTTRLYMNSNSLLRFNTAIRNLKRADPDRVYGNRKSIDDLLSVMKPVVGRIRKNHYRTVDLDDDAIVENLRSMRSDDWQEYKKRLIAVASRVESGSEIGPDDIEILDDVADALDAECADLFRRISGIS